MSNNAPAQKTWHLAVFSRAPVPGHTKTRLAAEIGSAAACLVHVLCLRQILHIGDQWREASQLLAEQQVIGLEDRLATHLFMTPPDSAQQFEWRGVLPKSGWKIHQQTGKDLNERMSNAIFQLQKDQAPSNPVLLIGTDLPSLRFQHLQQAMNLLQHNPIVLGPASDGGYYLVGVNEPVTSWLFQQNSEVALPSPIEHIMRLAEKHRCSVELLDTLTDVDQLEDIQAVLASEVAMNRAPTPEIKILTQIYQHMRVRVGERD